MFDCKLENLIINKPIGEGFFGTVYPYRTSDDPTGEKWVIKAQKINPDGLRDMMQEIALGFYCQHPNIVPITGFDIQKLDSSTTEWQAYLKLPRMKESLEAKLHRHIQTQEFLSESEIIRYLHGFASGLMYFHERNIAHRDIKPENILLDKDGIVKIGDIGLAKFLENQEGPVRNDKNMGTPYYKAPETLEDEASLNRQQLCAADLWSMGITILELCLLKQRLIDPTWTPERKENELMGYVRDLEGRYSGSIGDLLSKLLKSDPEERIKVQEVKRILEELMVSDALRPQVVVSREDMLGELENSRVVSSPPRLIHIDEEVGIEETEERQGSRLEVVDQIHKLFEDFAVFKIDQAAVSLEIQILDKSVKEERLGEMIKRLNDEMITINYGRLERLTIDASSCQNITDSGLRELACHISSNFKSLNHLELNFARCDKITDSSFSELVFQISGCLKSLESLLLNFSCCSQLTDSSLQDLGSYIALRGKHLKSLSLYFPWCEQITEKSILEFQSSNLSNIVELRLGFGFCPRITEKAMREFAERINLNVNTLQKLWLAFARSAEFCEELSKMFRNDLKVEIY